MRVLYERVVSRVYHVYISHKYQVGNMYALIRKVHTLLLRLTMQEMYSDNSFVAYKGTVNYYQKHKVEEIVGGGGGRKVFSEG